MFRNFFRSIEKLEISIHLGSVHMDHGVDNLVNYTIICQIFFLISKYNF